MSDVSTAAFLGGQGIPVKLSQITTELEALWGPAAEQAGGPDLDQPAVTKVVLANVVVSALGSEPELLAPVLQDFVSHFPCRAIVLTRAEHAGRAIHAEVSANCNLPVPGQPQVCSERIVLMAGTDALDLLPGAVRPLLESDVPFFLWWTDDPRETPDIYNNLLDEVTRSLLDRPDPSADPAFLRFSAASDQTRDTAWHGITPWRELVAQFFDPSGTGEDLNRLDSLAIVARAATNERPTRVAAWLVAWMAGQLGWTPVSRSEGVRGGLDAVFQGPTRTIRVSLRTELDPTVAEAQLAQVRLTTADPDGEGTFDLTRSLRHPKEIRVEVCSATHCNLARRVRSPELDRARRVASALEARRDDPPYTHALPLVLWLLGVA